MTASTGILAFARSIHSDMKGGSENLSLRSVLKKRSSWTEDYVVVKKPKLRENGLPVENEDDVDRMQRVVDRKRRNASVLWVSGQMPEAVAEMCRAEALTAKLCPSLRSRAIKQSSMNASQSTSSRKESESTGRRVTFGSAPSIIGTADAQVDRQPIHVTLPTKLERLLIRAARILPSEGEQQPATTV